MRLLSLQVRDCRVLFLSAIMVLACAAAADAQRIRRPPKSDFHVGQKVEVEWMNKIVSGEVVSIEMTGWVKVRFQDDGNERVFPFPPEQVRVPKKPPATKTAGKPPIRTWTDSTGLFKLEARFVALKDGKVTLEKADGTTKTLPLDKLSEEDQTAAKKCAEKTSANPFEGSDDAAAPAGGTEGTPAKDEDIVAPAGDWSSVKDVMVDISSKGQFVPDAAGEPLQQMHTVTMDLTSGAKDRDFSRDKPAGLFYVRSRQRVYVASTNDNFQGGNGARIEACDLRTGKSLGAVVLDTGIIPCDVSPDGSSVVCMPPGLVSAFHKQRGIEVWRLEGGGKLAKRWDPNDTRDKKETSRADRAMFISRDLLLTVSGGETTVWDIDHARAVYTLPVDSGSRPALSANRKQLAVIHSGVVCVLDAATGQTLLALTAGDTPARGAPAGLAAARGRREFHMPAHLAFRPDGCQVAALGDGVIQVWDLQKQALAKQFWLPQSTGRFGFDAVEWVDNNYLLVNGSDLVDVAKQIVLWHYDVPGQARSACAVIDGHLAFGAAENARGRGRMQAGVFFVALPHAEAAQVAAGLTEEKLSVLKPGGQVSLDLRVPGATPQDIEAITASYTEQLKSYGVSVVAGAPLSFQGAVEAGQSESRTYVPSTGRFGFPIRGEKGENVNVTMQKCRLALMENGKVLWEHSMDAVGAGFFVQHKEGESVQAAVDKAGQQNVVNFFRNASLPGCIARQGEHGAYGFSRVTPMGLIAYDPTSEPTTPMPMPTPRRSRR